MESLQDLDTRPAPAPRTAITFFFIFFIPITGLPISLTLGLLFLPILLTPGLLVYPSPLRSDYIFPMYISLLYLIGSGLIGILLILYVL